MSDIKATVDTFFQQYKQLTFKKGSILLEPEQTPPGVFYLAYGMVRQYALSPAGDELLMNIYKPGSYFPMPWVVNDSVPKHFFEAMEKTVVWQAPKVDTVAFLKTNSDVMFDLMSRIFKGLEGYMLRMEQLMIGNASHRLITALVIAGRRFGKTKSKDVVIELRLTESDIASQAGLTRETVSREIQRLKEKGFLSFGHNTVTIHDLPALETELLL